MQESKEILTMRAMAWERAKGELRAYLQTYWSGNEEATYEKADAKIEAFIEDFEGEVG